MKPSNYDDKSKNNQQQGGQGKPTGTGSNINTNRPGTTGGQNQGGQGGQGKKDDRQGGQGGSQGGQR